MSRQPTWVNIVLERIEKLEGTIIAEQNSAIKSLNERLDRLETILGKIATTSPQNVFPNSGQDQMQVDYEKIDLIKKPETVHVIDIINILKNSDSEIFLLNSFGQPETAEGMYRLLSKDINSICNSVLRSSMDEYVPWKTLSGVIKKELISRASREAHLLNIADIVNCCKDNWAIYFMLQSCWSNKAPSKMNKNRKRRHSASNQ